MSAFKKGLWIRLLIVAALCLSLTACGKKTVSDPEPSRSAVETSQTTETSQVAETSQAAEASQVTDTPRIAEDGYYDSIEEVSLYLQTYGKLPSNYMTKKEAKKIGWQGGSLDKYSPGMCIGGDTYGNLEGLLPEGKSYHECDIDTVGNEKRGAKRIIYSDDGYIYYTEDHYASFELLYSPEG